MGHLPYKCWASLTPAVASLALACHPGVDAPGVPLYPNGATMRLPRGQIAQVSGPIGKIDGQEVVGQGGVFDLLPGCHLVELDRRMVTENYALSSGAYWSGQFPITIYAIRMKPGAHYPIRREMYSDGQSSRVVLSAREEPPNGAATDLTPATSVDDIRGCKEWATTALGK